MHTSDLGLFELIIFRSLHISIFTLMALYQATRIILSSTQPHITSQEEIALRRSWGWNLLEPSITLTVVVVMWLTGQPPFIHGSLYIQIMAPMLVILIYSSVKLLFLLKTELAKELNIILFLGISRILAAFLIFYNFFFIEIHSILVLISTVVIYYRERKLTTTAHYAINMSESGLLIDEQQPLTSNQPHIRLPYPEAYWDDRP